MSDESKTNSAKNEIEGAKPEIEDAEVVDETPKPGGEDSAASEDAAQGEATAETEGQVEEARDPSEDQDPTETPDDPDGREPDADAERQEHAEEPQPEEAAAKPEPAAEEQTEETGAPISAVILKYLVILLVGGAAALWAGPRIAPQLPAWAAPVAQFLTPGVDQASMRIAEAEAALEERVAAIAARVDEAEAEAAAAGDAAAAAVAAADAKAAETVAALTEKLDAVAEEPRADLSKVNGLAERLATAEATLAGLRTEIDGLGGFSTGGDAPSAETLERVAAFGAAVEGLRAEMASLSAAAAEVESKADGALVDELAQRIAALEAGEAATSSARADASDIRRDAAIDAALTRIGQALVSGAGFGEALISVEDLTGIEPPAGLSAVSGGAPTQDTLLRGFPLAAQDAYSAALVSEAGDGMVSTVFAKLQGRLGGRPATETQGEDPGAVLSRVEARLNEGRLAEARAEANALPADSQAAMGGWLATLDQAIAAADGLTTYAQALKTN